MLTIALGLTGCSRSDENLPRASASLEGGKIVVVGARPQFAAGAAPTTEGFFEYARWDEEIETLQCKGWAPLDVRTDTVRFVLRDPFDRLLLAGTPIFTPQERPDVAAAFPDRPALRHAGFMASIPVDNIPRHEAWVDTLELYCLDATGALFRLAPIETPGRQSWDRRGDRFEVALTYTTPELTVPEKKNGSLDVCEPGPSEGLVRFAGWASFDGQSPGSALIVQVAPTLAPAEIVSASWTPRPDVRAAVDPQRAELDRCGFELVLRVPAAMAELRKKGALRLWSIDAAQHAHELGLPALRARK